MARARQEMVAEIPAPRGTIFDRSGPGAGDEHARAMSVYINPLKVPICEVAGADPGGRSCTWTRRELYGTIEAGIRQPPRLPLDQAQDHTRRGQTPAQPAISTGSVMQRESQRHYPNGSAGGARSGLVDFEEKGNAGIEKALDEELRGSPGPDRGC